VSKSNNNVNPDHYKTAGREPQGQAVAHDIKRQEYGEIEAKEKRDQRGITPKTGGKSRALKGKAPK
jgi:hypothetical protein